MRTGRGHSFSIIWRQLGPVSDRARRGSVPKHRGILSGDRPQQVGPPKIEKIHAGDAETADNVDIAPFCPRSPRPIFRGDCRRQVQGWITRDPALAVSQPGLRFQVTAPRQPVRPARRCRRAASPAGHRSGFRACRSGSPSEPPAHPGHLRQDGLQFGCWRLDGEIAPMFVLPRWRWWSVHSVIIPENQTALGILVVLDCARA